MIAEQCAASGAAADDGVAEALGDEDDERIFVTRIVMWVPRLRDDAVDKDACPCDEDVGKDTKQQNDQHATDPSVHVGHRIGAVAHEMKGQQRAS